MKLISNSPLRIFCTLALILTGTSLAESSENTTAEEIQSRLTRLNSFYKLTVGPDDNYQFDLSPDAQWLTFTKKKGLTSQVFVKKVSEESSQTIHEENFDGKDPRFSSSGQEIAYVRNDGKIRSRLCIYNLSQKDNRCFDETKGNLSGLQWLSKDELAYINTETGKETKILRFNRKTKAQSLVATGNFQSFAFDEGAKKLYVVSPDGESEHLVWRIDDSNGKKESIAIHLPGVASGLSLIKKDGESYLLFNQYFSDTNADGFIDALDNSVIFKLPLSDKTHETPASFPLQLTSSDSNCANPKLLNGSLYISCAFRGSIDVYQLPSSGRVPQEWKKKEIQAAIRTARNYSERIMLENHLAYHGHISLEETVQRQLLNHLFDTDFSAAKYYAKKASDTSIVLLIENWQKYQSVQADKITPSLRAELGRKMHQLKNAKTDLLQGAFFHWLQGQHSSAKKKLASIDVKMTQVEAFFYAGMVTRLLKVGAYSDTQFRERLLPLLTNNNLPLKAQLFYANVLLENLRSAPLNATEKKAELTKIKPKLSVPLQKLFGFEHIAYSFEAEDESAVRNAMSLIVDQAREVKDDYEVRTLAFTRLIKRSIDQNLFDLTNGIISLWLRFTERYSHEYTYILDIFLDIQLERAYENYLSGKSDLAQSSFYGSLTATDDLESHYGYLFTSKILKKLDTAKSRYNTLFERQKIGYSRPYIDVMAQVMGTKELSEDTLLDLIQQLHSMKTYQPEPMRYLGMGALQVRLFLLRSKAYDIDKELLQKAHHNLSLAADLGRYNPRIVASAVDNLSVLHERASNYGFALKYLELRNPYGFINLQAEKDFRWRYARMLFYNDRAMSAYEEIKRVHDKASKLEPMWYERLGFYALHAEKYEESLKAYSSLQLAELSPANKAKVSLSQGFALLKLERNEEANKAFEAAIKTAPRDKIKWLALGFQSKINDQDTKALAQRVAIGKKHTSEPLRLNLSPASLNDFLIRDMLELSIRFQRKGNNKEAQSQVREALEVSLAFAKDKDEPTLRSLYESAFLALSMQQDIKSPATFADALQSAIQSLIEGYKSLPYPTDFNHYQHARLLKFSGQDYEASQAFKILRRDHSEWHQRLIEQKASLKSMNN